MGIFLNLSAISLNGSKVKADELLTFRNMKKIIGDNINKLFGNSLGQSITYNRKLFV